MKRSNLTIALYICLVFLSGVAVGGFGMRLYSGSPVKAAAQRKTSEDYRREYLDEMRSRLKLDDTQISKLITILDRTREDYRNIRERNKPEMQRIQGEQIDSVNILLSDWQKLEYGKMRAERDARKKASGDH